MTHSPDDATVMIWQAVAMLFCGLAFAGTAIAKSSDRNVVLVTLDGVRIQELFAGMDPVIANATEAESGIDEATITRARYWRETAAERREALMPFFWKTLVPAAWCSAIPQPAARSRCAITSGSRIPAIPRS